jgi:hypothetical protein
VAHDCKEGNPDEDETEWSADHQIEDIAQTAGTTAMRAE